MSKLILIEAGKTARRLELPKAASACAQPAFELSCSSPAGMEGIGLMHRAVTYKRVTISMCTPGELRRTIKAMLRRASLRWCGPGRCCRH